MKIYAPAEHYETVDGWQHDPAIGTCDDCDEDVILSGFTNVCDCGAQYNQAGQRLRDNWLRESIENDEYFEEEY